MEQGARVMIRAELGSALSYRLRFYCWVLTNKTRWFAALKVYERLYYFDETFIPVQLLPNSIFWQLDSKNGAIFRSR
jgi:hypothetical protein